MAETVNSNLVEIIPQNELINEAAKELRRQPTKEKGRRQINDDAPNRLKMY